MRLRVSLTVACLFIVLSLSVAHEACSRKLSRRVRSFLSEDVLSDSTIRSSSFTQECPLAPWNDMYEDQEKHKVQQSNGNWKCKYCNKEFKNEMYIDRHMDNMHSDKIGNRSICLGELCPMLGCRGINPTSSEHRSPQAIFGDYDRVKECTVLETTRKKSLCNMIASSCFGSLAGAERFTKLVCDKLHCENGFLKGAMRYSESAQGDRSLQLFFLVLKCVISLFIVIGAVSYASSSGVWNRLFVSKSPPSALKNFKFDRKPKESILYKLRSLVYKGKKDH